MNRCVDLSYLSYTFGKFSKQQTDFNINILILVLIFLKNRVLTFYANCLLGDNLHWLSTPYVLEEEGGGICFKKSSAEIFYPAL